MTTDYAPIRNGTKLAAAAAAAVIVGGMVLVGWALDIAVLKSIQPVWVSMKANTAVCFVLIGIALWLTARQSSHSNLFARFCSLLAGLIGMLTLGEYIFGWNPGIDQWLFVEPPDTVGTSYPGRMAPDTALNFVLLSVALWVINVSRQTRYSILFSVSIGLLVAALALATLLSYLTPALGPYGWFGHTIMAVHTAILFTLLGMAVIAISWQPKVLSWSLSRRTTAAFACGMVLLVFIGLSTSHSQFWMNETNRQIAYTEKVQGDIGNILVEVIDAQVRTRGYVITGDELSLKHFLAVRADCDTKLGELRRVEFEAAKSAHQQHFSEIEAKVKAQFQWLQQVIDARRTGMDEATRNNMVRHGEDLLNGLRSTFDRIGSEHRQLVQQLKQDAENVSRLIYSIIFFSTCASLLIFLGVIYRLNSAVNEREQKERALQESEGKFHAIFKEAKDGIALTDAETGLIADCNAEFERQCGRPLSQLKTLHPWGLRPPEQQEAAHSKFEEIKTVGTGGSSDLEFQQPGGKIVPVEFRSIAITIAGKRYIQSISRDISERKAHERQLNNLNRALRLLSACNAALAHAQSEEELFRNVCRLIVETGGYKLAWVAYPGAGTDGIPVPFAHFGNESLYQLHAELDHDPEHLQHCLTFAALRECKTRVCNGSYGTPECASDPLRTEGVESILALPLLHDNEAYGVLTIFASIAASFGAAEIRLAEELAGDLAYGIASLRARAKREQAELALRENEKRFRAAMDTVLDAFVIVESEHGTITWWNAAAEAMFGYSKKEMIGQAIHDFLPPPRFREAAQRGMEHFAKTGEGAAINKSLELAALHKNGAEFPIELSLSAIQIDGKWHASGIVRDITARKQAEAKLAEQLGELRRWHDATLGREMRILELKHEVNELLDQAGQSPRYPGAE